MTFKIGEGAHIITVTCYRVKCQNWRDVASFTVLTPIFLPVLVYFHPLCC